MFRRTENKASKKSRKHILTGVILIILLISLYVFQAMQNNTLKIPVSQTNNTPHPTPPMNEQERAYIEKNVHLPAPLSPQDQALIQSGVLKKN